MQEKNRSARPEGMMDLHCHILPGIDDGSPSLEESLEMARLAIEGGTRVIAATPHCGIPGAKYPNFYGDWLWEQLERFTRVLEEERIPLTVCLGAEAFGTDELPELARQGRIPTLNGSQYLLVEFPFRDRSAHITDIAFGLLDAGFTPVIAHPERYDAVQQSLSLASTLWEEGCLLQVNSGSLMGHFGPGPEETALRLLEEGLADIVASDAHRSARRTPYLGDVYSLIEQQFSPGYAAELLIHRPGRILEGKTLDSV